MFAVALGTLASASACFLVSGLSYLEDGPGDGGLGEGAADDSRPIADVGPDVLGDSSADACVIMSGGNACTTIAPFSGTQIVDGIGNEFCNIVATEVVIAHGADPEPLDAAGVNTTALVRVGWSDAGLHIHIHVDQPEVNPPSTTSSPPAPIYLGDGVEIFGAPSTELTGPFGAGADRAVQVIVTPPGDAQPARSGVLTSLSVNPYLTLTAQEFAARLVDGGYEVEMALSWSFLAGMQEAGPGKANQVIAFDFACDVARDAGRFQSFLGYRDAGREAGRGCGQQPHCDDLTWCIPTLAP